MNKTRSQTQQQPDNSASQLQRRAESPPPRPTLATPTGVLQLQRTAGNAATHRLIQAKLTVGAAHDPLEQEADRVADRVVNRSSLQRNPEEDELQAMRIQRAAQDEDELMTKRGSMLDSFDAGSDFESKLGSSGSGTSLDGKTRSQMEAGIGADFSKVRVHTGDHASSLNRSISARAFTRGSNVFFDKGQYNPGSIAGKRLIAHELTHVVQQGGAAQSTQRKASPDAIQRWPWSKKKNQTAGANANTPTADQGAQVSNNAGTEADAESADKPALTIAPDYSNKDAKDQAPTRFKFSVIAWQDSKIYLDFQKIRAMSTMRNRMRGMAREVPGMSNTIRTPKNSAQIKSKSARKIAERDANYANLDDAKKKEARQLIEDQSSDLGHTWTRMTAYAGDQIKDIYSFGFWPAKGILNPAQATEGEVKHPDQVHDGESTLRVMHYDIPAKNYETALRWADKQVQNPPQYKMIGLNCTSWAKLLASKAGVSFPSSGNTFPAEPAQGFIQQIYSPNKLYDDMGKKKGHEDTLDAVPKNFNPYFFSFGNVSEESEESVDLPERGSEHTLVSPLRVTGLNSGRALMIRAGALIRVQSAWDADDIIVDSREASGSTDAKSFWEAVNGRD